MKELRCKMCGGTLLAQHNSSKVVCGHCGAAFQFTEQMNYNDIQRQQVNNLLARAEDFLQQGNFWKAKWYLEKAKDVDMSHPRISELQQYITQAEKSGTGNLFNRATNRVAESVKEQAIISAAGWVGAAKGMAIGLAAGLLVIFMLYLVSDGVRFTPSIVLILASVGIGYLVGGLDAQDKKRKELTQQKQKDALETDKTWKV